MKEILCGIDLGTTNSCIAYLMNGKAVSIPVEEGDPIVPSVVSLDEISNKLLVGKQARNRQSAFPDHTVFSIKRLMGKDHSTRLGSRTFSPEEISSIIIRYLVDKGQEIVGEKITNVVITVPAYFNDAQRRATIRAGELAGVEVTRIINEPTAASLIYDYSTLQGETDNPYVLVYDLGGGTFDVSILEVKGEIKEVLASCGDTSLGGDDFDQRLIDFFLRHLKGETGIDLSGSQRSVRVRLKEIAEKTKIALSDHPYVSVKEVGIATIDGKPVNLDIELSRREYEDLIRDYVQKTTEKVEEALKEAHLVPEDIGKIILVGGSTKTPLVQEGLTRMFDRPIYHSIDPDLCVGLGAAVQSGLIAGEPLGHILLDVTAHSLGVKTIDTIDYETDDADFFSVIIRRNTRIPVRKGEVYYTIHDGQKGVDVEIFQGESPSCKENTLIGRFYFPLKPSPDQSPVLTEFAYDKEGIVHIVVDQKGYHNRREVTLDVRRKKILEEPEEETDQEIINYILEKARKLKDHPDLSVEFQKELTELALRYEEALKREGDSKELDDLEDLLVGKMEEAEERLEPGE